MTARDFAGRFAAIMVATGRPLAALLWGGSPSDAARVAAAIVPDNDWADVWLGAMLVTVVPTVTGSDRESSQACA